MRNAIKTIADKLTKDGFQTILVVPASGGEKYGETFRLYANVDAMVCYSSRLFYCSLPGRFRTEDFNFLASSVKAFSVMTYDHPKTYSRYCPHFRSPKGCYSSLSYSC